MKTTWIIQGNLHPTGDVDTSGMLARACQEAECPFVRVKVIPSSTEMPEITGVSAPFVFYGYSTPITNAHRSSQWSSGVFFDPELFRPSVYADRYGDLYLNPDTRVLSHEQFIAESHRPDEGFFIRPDDDLKEWTGQVMSFAEYVAWHGNLEPTRHIAVSAPKAVESEWRVFLVDGQPVASSQYRPQATHWVPVEVEAFARRAAARWSPVPVYGMDVASVEGELKLIELNCFNGSSFYLADINRIVRTVSVFMEATTV